MAIKLDTVGKRIRILRQDLNMSQIELATEMSKLGVNVSNGYISELEGKDKVPSAKVLGALARVLGTSTDYLLMLTEENDVLPEEETGVISIDNKVIYEVPSPATRQLAQRLLTTFSEMSDSERAYVVDLAEQLRKLTKPRIIGDDNSTEV